MGGLRLVAVLLTLSEASAADSASLRKPVIVVADVGVDDAAALLWAIGSPELEVLGVASSLGCHSDARNTAANAVRVLVAANRSDVPVFVGSRFPLGQSAMLEVDGSRFHGPTGFGKPPTTEEEAACSAVAPTNMSAAEFIAGIVRSRPGEITLLSFSPLTDVALALLIEPRLPFLLNSLVLMGAAVYTAGNAMPLAEANFLHDAAAAQLVVRSFTEGSRLVIAPLDVTMKEAALIKSSVVQTIRGLGHAGALFADAYAYYSAAYCEIQQICGASPLHDAMTVAYAVDPTMFTRTAEVLLDVIVAPGSPGHGQSFVDQRVGRGLDDPSAPKRGWRATLLLDVDGDRFVKGLVDGIAGLNSN